MTSMQRPEPPVTKRPGINERFDDLLFAWGLTYTEAARRLGVTDAYLYRVRSGERKPSATLVRLLQLLVALEKAWGPVTNGEPMRASDQYRIEKLMRRL